jgi:VanZ family protein
MSVPARRALKRSLAPLACMALIFALSSLPGDTEAAWWEPIVRTIGHVGEFALLTVLWSWALAPVVRRPVWVAAAIALTYACADEYHQSFVENRDATVADVGLDALGIALAGFAISRVSYLQGPGARRPGGRAA